MQQKHSMVAPQSPSFLGMYPRIESPTRGIGVLGSIGGANPSGSTGPLVGGGTGSMGTFVGTGALAPFVGGALCAGMSQKANQPPSPHTLKEAEQQILASSLVAENAILKQLADALDAPHWSSIEDRQHHSPIPSSAEATEGRTFEELQAHMQRMRQSLHAASTERLRQEELMCELNALHENWKTILESVIVRQNQIRDELRELVDQAAKSDMKKH
eukprot:GEMP01087539.1.p1 GENE.GEMP01087539.1~~GEMP01087539.1.p1  ORF type:complete len:248 (+),score=51.40 GEMP01087539.1:98-745(+)